MLLDAASVMAVITNYNYLVFTENTNLTTTPIKFAVPPFSESGTNFVVWQNGFADTNSSQVPPWIYTPAAGTYFAGGWYLVSGTVDDIYRNYQGGLTLYGGENYCLDIDGNNPGAITTNLAMVPGQTYILSFAYTKNPSAATTPHAAVFLGGNQLGTLAPNIANSWSSLDWQTTSYVFTATATLSQLAFQSLDTFPEPSGVFLDDVTLSVPTTGLYYLPEQSLDTYDGLNAQGTWTLEIQDDRVGATNPTPVLLSWQLRFNYVTFGTNANGDSARHHADQCDSRRRLAVLSRSTCRPMRISPRIFWFLPPGRWICGSIPPMIPSAPRRRIPNCWRLPPAAPRR